MRNQTTIVDRIRIRSHPSEPPGKYRHLLDQYRHIYDLEESRDPPLVKDCAWADWIVGCQGMATVIGGGGPNAGVFLYPDRRPVFATAFPGDHLVIHSLAWWHLYGFPGFIRLWICFSSMINSAKGSVGN